MEILVGELKPTMKRKIWVPSPQGQKLFPKDLPVLSDISHISLVYVGM